MFQKENNRNLKKIDETYNKNYLRAEYNFVQQSAEMAAKWEQIEEDGDRYNLQYRTAGDDRVRPEHAALNGVTLPPSDEFWESYYPPNGWNCRCTVVQVRKSKYPETPREEAMARGEDALQKDTKGMFRFNPGKEQKTVPDYNPYTIRRCNDCDISKNALCLAAADNEVCAACQCVNKNADEKEKSKTAIERQHYLQEMEPLLERKLQKETNGGNINVGFSKRGNKHLYSDTFKRTKIVTKDDLKNIDQILEDAEFIGDAEHDPTHNNPYEHFYYYKAKVHDKWIRINVGKETVEKKNGKIYVNYEVYSVNDIKK